MGGTDTFYPTLLWDEKSAVLVDTGVPGLAQRFKEALAEASVPWEQLQTILITHQDLDHIGSLPSLLDLAGPGLNVLAHAEHPPMKYLAYINKFIIANRCTQSTY